MTRLPCQKGCNLDIEVMLGMILSSVRATGLGAIFLGSVLMFGCLAFTIPASGQQPLQTLLVGVDRRTVTSLDGDWHYLVDQSPAQALYNANSEINDKSYAMNTDRKS